MLLSAIASGFIFGLGLIFSLGPQNLLLLRAGATRNHPLAVASAGYASEIVFVALGIGGLGTLLAYHPEVSKLLQIVYALFLLWWGLRILARLGNAQRVELVSAGGNSLYPAITAMLAVTWLNPLAWFEAMFLVGVLSSGHHTAGFAAGFLAASAIKFYGWSFAGLSLSRHLGGAAAHRGLDAVAGLVLLLAAGLTVAGAA